MREPSYREAKPLAPALPAGGYILFIHSEVDGPSGWFHLLALVKKAAMDTGVQCSPVFQGVAGGGGGSSRLVLYIIQSIMYFICKQASRIFMAKCPVDIFF